MLRYLFLLLLLSPVSVWGQTQTACSVTLGYNQVGTGSNAAGTIFGNFLPAQSGTGVVDTIWGYYNGSGANGFGVIIVTNGGLAAITPVQAVTTGWNKFSLAGPITLDQTNGNGYVVAVQFSDGYRNFSSGAAGFNAFYAQTYDGTYDNPSASYATYVSGQVAVFADYCSNPIVYPPNCSLTIGTNLIGNQLTQSVTTQYGNNLTISSPTTINAGWIYNWGPATNALFGVYIHDGVNCPGPVHDRPLVATSLSTAIPACSWSEIPLTASYAMTAGGQYLLEEFIQSGDYMTNFEVVNGDSQPVTGNFMYSVTWTGTLLPYSDCLNEGDQTTMTEFADFCQTATHSHGDLLGVWW